MKIDRTNKAVQFIELNMVDGKSFAQCEKELGITTEVRKRWYDEQVPLRDFINKLKRKWRNHARDVSFKDFYEALAGDQRCHYCGITQDEIDRMYREGRLPTSGRLTRGKPLEVERLAAKESYSSLGNLAWACYWCNNAKSDLFSEEEFKPIGKAIGDVHRSRLAYRS
jgi:hypothetical protein